MSSMQTILREREGIIQTSVDFAKGIIRVKYDPLLLDRKAVFSEVRRLGFAAIRDTSHFLVKP
jgi:copper chaperone CopZ